MIIKTSFEVLESTMATVSSIVSDKTLNDSLKNLIVWVKGEDVHFAAYNGPISNVTKVDASVEFAEGEAQGEVIFQLRAKEINDTLSTLKGLKRTKIAGVEFHIFENEAILHIHEVALEEDDVNAHIFNQTSKFRITKPKLNELAKSEITKIDMSFQGTEISTVELLIYINALLPTISKETRESTRAVTFGPEHIFTTPSSYSAIMPNRLDDVLKGFRLDNSVVTFIKNFISMAETFHMSKQEQGNGAVNLTLRVLDSIATIKCADMSRAFDITNFISMPPNGVVVDKAYLTDVLKRMSLSSDPTQVEIEIFEDGSGGTMRVVSKNMTQNIPIIKAKGAGSYSFNIRDEVLRNVIFSHVDFFEPTVFLYLEYNERGNITLACTDNKNIWHTKLMNLSPAKADFNWK